MTPYNISPGFGHRNPHDAKLLLLEPRQRLGGTGTSASDVLAYAPPFRYGLPAIWISQRLETSIRDLIRARLMEADKENWWERFVVQFIRDNAAANKKKETESGVTPRSDDWLSYTNF